MIIVGCVLLWCLPLGTHLLARRKAPRMLWRATGIALGLVVVPASGGLYDAMFMVPPLALLGLVPAAVSGLHSHVADYLATSVGIVQPDAPIKGALSLCMFGVDAVVWSCVYGAIGWGLDVFVVRRRSSVTPGELTR